MPEAKTPEQIAREIAEKFFIEDEWSQEPLAERIASALTRMREEAIEEAAKIADEHVGRTRYRIEFEPGQPVEVGPQVQAPRSIAAAIRALAQPKQGDES